MTGVLRRPAKPIPARPAAPRPASRPITTRPVSSPSSTPVIAYRNQQAVRPVTSILLAQKTIPNKHYGNVSHI